MVDVDDVLFVGKSRHINVGETLNPTHPCCQIPVEFYACHCFFMWILIVEGELLCSLLIFEFFYVGLRLKVGEIPA